MKKLNQLTVLLIILSLQFNTANADEDSPEDSDKSAPQEQVQKEQVQSPTLFLQVGQRYPLEGLQNNQVEVQPSSIVSAHPTPEGTLLVAHAPGEATLTAQAQDKKIKVKILVKASNAASAQPSQNTSDLKNIPGLKIQKLGNKILIQGEILSRLAYQKILFYLKHFSKNFIVVAKAAPGIQPSLIEQTRTLLNNQGLQDVSISNAGHRFFLEGRVSSPEAVEQALELTQSVIPNVENHLAIPIRIEPTITIRLFILELSRQAHESLGLSWPINVTQAIQLSPKESFINPSWSATLKHLSQSGQAKVLAEPMLAVKSGSAAELSAGGEIPLRITGHFENKIVWKHYGLKIKIQIPGIAGKYIRTIIHSESSQLDASATVDGIPGIRRHSMNTSLDAQENQPVLLTGLFHSSIAKDVEKVPFLGQIPILGELFKSRQFRERESELLVALLPSFGAPTTTLPLQSAHGLEFDKRWRILD